MKKRSRLLAGFAAAALTFGSLMVFLGPKHFAKYGHHQCHHSVLNSFER